MLTVLQVTPALDAGGVERTTIDIAAALAAAGGRALVASSGGRLEGELADVGGELRRMAVQSKNPLHIALNAALLADIIRREEVDVVHARSRAPAWSALWAARATGRPFVTTYHGTYNAKSSLKRWYNSVMARADRVIANSEFIAAHVRKVHGVEEGRLRVIPRGVDLEAFDPGAISPERIAALRQAWDIGDDPRAVILLPGRLTRWKGQETAIQALARMRAQLGPRALLVMPGDDQGRVNYRENLMESARMVGVEHAVRLPGHCCDMPAAYALADVVVSASIEPEAFGRVAAEGQAMGRPVIATAHGGSLEVVVDGEGGRLVIPGDPDDLAAALSDILCRSAGERIAMGAKGAERVRRLYSKPAMQAATLAVYEEAAEAKE